MNEITSNLHKYALELGADLIGFADIQRFEGAPKEFHPATLLPEAESVISIAIRILKGVQIPQRNLTQNYQYQTFGYGWLSHIRLNTIAFEISRYLEDAGYVTLPFPSFCDTQNPDLTPDWVKRDRPSISHRHAAVACGIATFGWNNLALTERFGARNRFVTIITKAKLEQTPLIEESVCNMCKACVQKCPGNAISDNESCSFELAGKNVKMATIKKPTCSWYHDGIATETFGTVPFKRPENLSWDEVVSKRRAVDMLSPAQFGSRITTFAPGGHCGLCLLYCPAGSAWSKLK